LARLQVGDGTRVVPDRAQHFLIVRAGLGRHAVELAAAVRQLEAAAGEAQSPVGRVDLLHRAARRDLRMIDHVLDLPDAGAGRAGAVEDAFPLARALLRERLLDDRPQRRLVLLPGEPVGKARVLQRVLAADRRHQRDVLLLVVDGEQQMAVTGLEEIGGRLAAHGLVAGQLLAMAGDGIVSDLTGQEGQRRLQHGDVDELPLAGLVALEQRAGDTEGCGCARQHIADRKARARRAALYVAGDRHDAAHRLHLAVIAGAVALGPGLAETAYRAINQLRIDRRERLVADAELVHHARAEILHHDVGLFSELLDDGNRLGLGQVDRQAALV